MRTLPVSPCLSAIAICCVLAACATKPASQGPTLSGDARARVALAAEQSGDFPLADTMYAEAATENPTDASAQMRYADVLLRQGKVTEARDLLLRHIGTVSDPTQLQSGLAAIDVLSGEAARALAEYDKLLAVDPNDMRLVVNKAVALDMLGRHEEAQTLYRRALYATPDDPVVISDFALSLVLSGKTREASALVAPLRDADNVSARVRNNIAVVLAAGGKSGATSSERGNSAIAQIAQALNLGTGSKPANTP
jgi:Flp pilus assembly protein TadD